MVTEKTFYDKSVRFTNILVENGREVSKCIIEVNKDTWQISSWYTKEDCLGQGFGKKCMRELINHIYSKLGEPSHIEYIWNGQNEYVHEWMQRNFYPISKCPIAVQKYQADDDWESHIYMLNVNAFLTYFGTKAEKKTA